MAAPEGWIARPDGTAENYWLNATTGQLSRVVAVSTTYGTWDGPLPGYWLLIWPPYYEGTTCMVWGIGLDGKPYAMTGGAAKGSFGQPVAVGEAPA